MTELTQRFLDLLKGKNFQQAIIELETAIKALETNCTVTSTDQPLPGTFEQ